MGKATTTAVRCVAQCDRLIDSLLFWQYRTGIYCHSEEQKALADASLTEQQKRHTQPVATEVVMAKPYWPAEAEHQNYLARGGRFGDVQSRAKGCQDPIRCYG